MFNVTTFLHYLVSPYILAGVGLTIALTVVPMIIALPLSLGLALARQSGLAPVAGFARAYVWLLRGTPLLVQLVIVYTALPEFGLKFSVWTSSLVALSMNESAYLSEIVRSGFAGVPVGQRDAALALGLSRWRTLRHVTLPQATRLMLPPIGNSVNALLKATSLTSVISMEELMRRSQVIMQINFQVLELLAVATVWYLALTTVWELVQVRLERRFGRGHAVVAVELDSR